MILEKCVREEAEVAKLGTRFRHRHKQKSNDHFNLIIRHKRHAFQQTFSVKSIAILIIVLIFSLSSLVIQDTSQSATTKTRPKSSNTKTKGSLRTQRSANNQYNEQHASGHSFKALASESKTKPTHFIHPNVNPRLEPVTQIWPASISSTQQDSFGQQALKLAADRHGTTRGFKSKGRTFQEAITAPINNKQKALAARSLLNGMSKQPIDVSLGTTTTTTLEQKRRTQRSNMNGGATTATITPEMNRKCGLILQRTYVRKVAANEIDSDADQADNQPVEPTGRMEQVCITYDDVNKAIEEAKRRRNFKLTKELMEAIESIEPEPKHIAELGELNQEVTKILTNKYDLSPDEILNGLPLIDMSRTSFWSICPLMVKPIQCDASGRFRSFTGHCNNLDNPIWGASQTPFVRFLAPRHPDGIEQDRVSALDESALPAPRLVTSQVHRDADRPSSDLTLLIMVLGQFIDHDVAQAAPPRNEQGLDFNCCRESHPNCKPLEIAANDPLYSRFGERCMDFKRSLAGLRPNCALGPRVHINTITPTVDGNTIYGSTKAVADQLRSFSGGALKVQNSFDSMGLKPLLPKQLVRPDLDCFERPRNIYCFLAGDDRVNEQPTLTVMHTVWNREHNRIAGQLEKLNSHWDDDRIYHETRHIVAAELQNILVSEYLPMLVGKDMMNVYNLTRSPRGAYWQGYDADVTPSISQGFSTAAFRQGHTFIQGKVRLHDSQSHNFIDSIQLRRLFKRPFHYYQPGRMDQVLAGIVNTPAQSYDPFITEEIGGHLFQEPGMAFGMDLPAINLARGREQGVPGYNLFREWCGLPKARNFEQLVPLLANQTAFKYANLYKHVDDIDLWSGGVSEYPLPGALVGPTFACIIARQFANIKRGDRFWYENAGFPSQFTIKQLDEIRKTTVARVLCRNSDNMRTIQRQALKLPHPIMNPRMNCRDLPEADLKYWREDPNSPGSFPA